MSVGIFIAVDYPKPAVIECDGKEDSRGLYLGKVLYDPSEILKYAVNEDQDLEHLGPIKDNDGWTSIVEISFETVKIL